MPQHPQSTMHNTSHEEENSPLDSIIERVDSYIADPSLVDRKTLQDLKEELVDLRSFMDGDEEAEETVDEEGMDEGDDEPGLVVAIGRARRGIQGAIAAIFLMFSTVYADPARHQDFDNIPVYNNMRVSLASHSVLTPNTTNVFLSTTTTVLTSISINTPSPCGGTLDIWNARATTATLSNAQLMYSIDTATKTVISIPFMGVYFSSGLGSNNRSNCAEIADVTVTFYER